MKSDTYKNENTNEMDIITIIGLILGSNLITVFVTTFLTRKRIKAETHKITAEEVKILAEARKINIESDMVVSEGYKHVADVVIRERDRLIERNMELETLLEKEEEMNKARIEKVKNDGFIIETELRNQLRNDRAQYVKQIDGILDKIMGHKVDTTK